MDDLELTDSQILVLEAVIDLYDIRGEAYDSLIESQLFKKGIEKSLYSIWSTLGSLRKKGLVTKEPYSTWSLWYPSDLAKEYFGIKS